MKEVWKARFKKLVLFCLGWLTGSVVMWIAVGAYDSYADMLVLSAVSIVGGTSIIIVIWFIYDLFHKK